MASAYSALSTSTDTEDLARLMVMRPPEGRSHTAWGRLPPERDDHRPSAPRAQSTAEANASCRKSSRHGVSSTTTSLTRNETLVRVAS